MAKSGCLAEMFLALICLASLGVGPADAQESRSRMRVTGSSTVVRYSGWEKGLIDKDPSLKHWTWMPIDSYRYKTQAVPLPARSAHVYTRPAHVNTVAPRRHSNPYVHIETLARPSVSAALMPRRKTNPYVHIETYGKISHSDVSGQLSQESVSGQVAVPAPVATYGDAYGSIQPRSSARGSLINERRDVYGRVKGYK